MREDLFAVSGSDLADEVDNHTQTYYESNDGRLLACIVTPHNGNDFMFLVRVGYSETFDKWGNVEFETKVGSLEDAKTVLRECLVAASLEDFE